eukprot:a890279_4.p1 GENE.a890279_4~~a890279_4.p1  ORF type:complete len:138 (-),score=34.80 a890279_4:94-477(-)
MAARLAPPLAIDAEAVAHRLRSEDADPTVVVDVRPAAEFAAACPEGAINVSMPFDVESLHRILAAAAEATDSGDNGEALVVFVGDGGAASEAEASFRRLWSEQSVGVDYVTVGVCEGSVSDVARCLA